MFFNNIIIFNINKFIKVIRSCFLFYLYPTYRQGWYVKYFKYSKDKIGFFDKLVYIDQHQKLQTSLYQKPRDSQNDLYANS